MMLERLCSVSDVPDGEARRFDLGKLRFAVVHIGTDWYAIGDKCTHQDISLADGEVHAAKLEIECAKHGSCFSLTSGEPNSMPATRATPVYTVRIDDDAVYVEID